MRSPITLRCTSLVPPAMVRHRAERKPWLHRPASPSVVALAGTELHEPELLEALLVLGAEQLAHARLGTGLDARHRPQRGPGAEQRQRLGLGQQAPDTVEDDGVFEPRCLRSRPGCP